jgi:hypothetical protein
VTGGDATVAASPAKRDILLLVPFERAAKVVVFQLDRRVA